MKRLTGGCIHQTVRSTGSTAASFDHLLPQEIKLTTGVHSEWLANIYQMIEAEYCWPINMLRTRAAFLLKPAGNPNHLTNYRLLLSTSTLYRLWAKCRSRQLDEWALTWADGFDLSAAPGAGAHDGHYDVAVQIAHAIVKSLLYGGSCTDIEKCFDRILREVIIPIAIRAGFPISIIITYLAYIENITIYHDHARGLGKPRKHQLPIPQGCPFSMRPLALIIAPRTKIMQVQGAIPRALADDLTTIFIWIPQRLRWKGQSPEDMLVRIGKKNMRQTLAEVRFANKTISYSRWCTSTEISEATLTSLCVVQGPCPRTELKMQPDNATNLTTYPGHSGTGTAPSFQNSYQRACTVHQPPRRIGPSSANYLLPLRTIITGKTEMLADAPDHRC